jgi:hypothetical protein
MRRGTRVLSIGVLAVLIAVNLLLLFLLFRPDQILIARPPDHETGDLGLPTATTSTSASQLEDKTASAGPYTSIDPTSSTPPVQSVPVERLLLATSSKTAWRATVGDCNTAGEIERSINGGVSWERVVRTGLAPIVRLGVEPTGDLFTIGGSGESCTARYVAYAKDGTATASGNRVANLWFPTPKNRDEINGPGGTQASPCIGHVVGLAPLKPSEALVICDNGAAQHTRNSGKTWREVARMPGTLAVAAGSGRYWTAGVHQDCTGVMVQSLTEKDGRLKRGRSQCAHGLDASAGQLAIDVASGKIWLWSGNRIVVSTDDGQTWR